MTTRLCVLGATFGVVVSAAPVRAQQPMPGATTLTGVAAIDATAGSMTERTLLITGLLSPAGISTIVRPVARWPQDTSRPAALWPLRARIRVSTPEVVLWRNTDRPAVDRDGAVWQGRGVTMALSGGAVADVGPLSVAFRPLVSSSQNADYSPMRGPRPVDLRYPIYGARIDMPYRFGRRAYTLVSPGETWITLNAWKFSAGASAASQVWGPAHYYPLVLGTEGGGYPRLFLEGRAIPLRIGTVNMHWSLGRLEASSESTLPAGRRSRFAAAALASLTPAGFPGLEVGASRFFHGRLEKGSFGMSTAMMPFNRLFRNKTSGEISSLLLNQIASVFARVAPPGAGVEVYTEFYREDHNFDLRDLVGEPDHESAYTIGLRRAWRAGESVRAVTLETANGRITHLARIRPELPLYIHKDIAEGHTYLGQPLGSVATLGGNGYVAAFDIVEPHRSRLFEVEMRRTLQGDDGGSYADQATGVISARVSEWRDRGKLSLGASVRGTLGTGYLPGNNLTFMLSARGGWFQKSGVAR